MIGVSFVIPVRNGAPWLDSVLAAVRGQTWSGPIEIIAIDDGSTDDSAAILSRHQSLGDMRVLSGDGSGAAAAINKGVRAAAYPLIAQVDQDVVISPNWLARLVAEFDDPKVAAAQGRYLPGSDEYHEGSVPLRKRGQTPQTSVPLRRRGQTPRDIWSRVMALDLALRYRGLASTTNHVCTGNSLYRRSSLLDVGIFDEDLGYGYDNDLSYRLVAAGYRLAYRHDAESVHHWREGVVGYAQQQYGFGYGRLNLLTRHPRHVAGDDVSGLSMMLQGPVTAVALAVGLIAIGVEATGTSGIVPASVALALAAGLAVERFAAGAWAAVVFRDSAGLCFVPVHLVRNVAWVVAMTTWSARTLVGVRSRPVHSMRPRSL
jgi:mycofactocin glycosyltransferase